MIQEIANLILEKKVCCKAVQPSVKSLVSLADMCDQKKDEIVIKQEVMTMYGWEPQHKDKGYKAWTFSEWLDVANKHKFDASFMTLRVYFVS